jgi:Helix-turn-helix domain
VAQRFSLKNNPIFQKFVPQTPPDAPTLGEETQEGQEIPEGQNLTVKTRPSEDDAHNMLVDEASESSPPVDVFTSSAQQAITLREEPPFREDMDFEGQNLTVRERPSEDDVQKLPPTRRSDSSSPQVLSSAVAPTHSPAKRSAGTEFPLQDHLDKALFFGFYNEVADELLPTLPPAAQVLYSRLFRLSYGFNRNYCTVSQPLLMERTGLSRNTIRTALQTLLDDTWIQIIGAGNRVSTTYRVILPREKHGGEQSRGAKIDAQNLRVKNRRVEFEGQNVDVKNRGAEFDFAEGQKPDRPNLSSGQENSRTTYDSNDLRERGSKFDAQDLPALLLTHRSSTLSQRQIEDPHTSSSTWII